MSHLSMDDIVSIKVEVSRMSAPAKHFNIGLIIGTEAKVSLAKEKRVTTYAGLSELAEAGFGVDSPEYQAASLYFAQSPAPDVLAVGLKGEDETVLQTLEACRGSGVDWYAFTLTKDLADTLEQEQIIQLATYVEAEKAATIWFNLLSSKEKYSEVMTALKLGQFSRTLSLYSTFSGTATAALMGYAMGANYDNAPAYTLAHKTIVGITTEAITSAELTEILNLNGNVYVTQGSYYHVFRNGTMANGFHFDDLLYLDMLVNSLALSVMNQLTTLPKVPQTADGVAILVTAITDPCQKMVSKGYLAPGKWTGRKVMTLEPGDTLAQGFQIMAESIVNQSQADRNRRIAPPIYVCVKTAGAIESLTIGLVVNQ